MEVREAQPRRSQIFYPTENLDASNEEPSNQSSTIGAGVGLESFGSAAHLLRVVKDL
jgi:hypothetical protein